MWSDKPLVDSVELYVLLYIGVVAVVYWSISESKSTRCTANEPRRYSDFQVRLSALLPLLVVHTQSFFLNLPVDFWMNYNGSASENFNGGSSVGSLFGDEDLFEFGVDLDISVV